MSDILKDIGIIIAGFLVGAIPFCFILGKIVGGKRLTEIGDKNPGGWNLVFNVSKIWGFIGIILDMAKGYFVYYLAYKFSSAGSVEILGAANHQLIAIIAGCAAVAGHNYTPYLKFNGGKGTSNLGWVYDSYQPFFNYYGRSRTSGRDTGCQEYDMVSIPWYHFYRDIFMDYIKDRLSLL